MPFFRLSSHRNLCLKMMEDSSDNENECTSTCPDEIDMTEKLVAGNKMDTSMKNDRDDSVTSMSEDGPIDMSNGRSNDNESMVSDSGPHTNMSTSPNPNSNSNYDNDLGSPEPEDLTIHEEEDAPMEVDDDSGNTNVVSSSSPPEPTSSPSSPPANPSIQSPPSSPQNDSQTIQRPSSSPLQNSNESPPSSPPQNNNDSIQSPPSSPPQDISTNNIQSPPLPASSNCEIQSPSREDEENLLIDEPTIAAEATLSRTRSASTEEQTVQGDNDVDMYDDIQTLESEEVKETMANPASPTEEGPTSSPLRDSAASPDNLDESVSSDVPDNKASPTNRNEDSSLSQDDIEEAPQSPEASIQSSGGMMGTPISLEESQSQSSPPPAPLRKEKVKKPAADEIEEGEDLEDGEIMDEEEEEEIETEEKKPEIKAKPSKKESSEKSKSREKERSSSDKKRKGGDKEKLDQEELDPVKRLLAEVKEKDIREKEEREKRRREKKRSHKDKDEKDRSKEKESSNISKKKRKMSDEEEDGPEFLFVRGASPGAGEVENWEESSVEDRRGGKRRRESDDANSPAHRHRRGHEGSTSPVRNRSTNERPKRREPKSDVICAYFMQGKCQKSAEQCNFSHDAVPPRKMELCKFWMMECCAKKEKCLYLHNDFPCKYFHTGLVCRMGDNCKFSHNPLSDVTKQVLLKHIETAPKEILGDFPRLNRTGALNLINKMEAKLKGIPFVEEENNENDNGMNQGHPHHNHGPSDRHGGQDRHGGFQDRHHQDRRDNRGHFGGPGHHDNSRGRGHSGHDRGGHGHDGHRGGDRDRRQSRWEQSQPTRGDQEKLQELMSEAGISGFYKDTLGDNHHGQGGGGGGGGPQQMAGNPSAQAQMFPQAMQNLQNPMLPHLLPQFLLPPQAQVGNPALANVLAQLNMPGATIVPPNIPNYPPPSVNQSKIMEDQNKQQEPPSDASAIPDNLPKMQRELFRRIQQQQLKNENKVQPQETPEPEEPEENWYSDDEEEDSKKKEELKAEINDQISSVLNQIRQQSKQQSSTTKEPESLKNFFGDTDLRPSTSSSATDFKDVDLRTGSSSIFKKINILPATEINASLSSHGPVTYKVFVVAGLRDKPDYSHVRHSLTPQAILMDPRFGAKKRSNSIPTPESPTDQSSDSLNQPMSIPNSTPIFDPRKGGGASQIQSNSGRGLLDNPFVQAEANSMGMPGMNMNNMMNDYNNPFNRDPRQANNVPPPAQPPNAATAAQLANIAAFMQQNWSSGQPPMDPANLIMFGGLNGGIPFYPPGQGASGPAGNPGMDFNMMQNSGLRNIRPPFMPGNQTQGPQPPPASSWERFNRGQGNLSPPL